MTSSKINHKLRLSEVNDSLDPLNKRTALLPDQALAYPPDPALASRIENLCGSDRPFLEKFQFALEAEAPGKEFFVAVLKAQPGGKWAQCETYCHDVPTLEHLRDKWGHGKFRLMLKYYNPVRRIKGGRGGYSITYRDYWLNPPAGTVTETAARPAPLAEYETAARALYEMQLRVVDILDRAASLLEKLKK